VTKSADILVSFLPTSLPLFWHSVEYSADTLTNILLSFRPIFCCTIPYLLIFFLLLSSIQLTRVLPISCLLFCWHNPFANFNFLPIFLYPMKVLSNILVFF
jgi:hypothetical protein